MVECHSTLRIFGDQEIENMYLCTHITSYDSMCEASYEYLNANDPALEINTILITNTDDTSVPHYRHQYNTHTSQYTSILRLRNPIISKPTTPNSLPQAQFHTQVKMSNRTFNLYIYRVDQKYLFNFEGL